MRTTAARSSSDDLASDDLTLPDVLQFMQLLWAVVHGIERRSKHMTRDLGVTGPQRLVLRVVGLVPGVSAGRLAEILHVHPSTLTGVLQRLAQQRLLQRSGDVRDRRRALFQLTARGRLINNARGGTVESVVAAALRDSSAADRASTRRVLERLAQRLVPGAAAERKRR
jgi:DNA-binding MarR family transcriptional regulator